MVVSALQRLCDLQKKQRGNTLSFWWSLLSSGLSPLTREGSIREVEMISYFC